MQSVHVEDPEYEYFPWGQARGTALPPAQLQPAGQARALVALVLPAGQYVPDGTVQGPVHVLSVRPRVAP